MNNIIFDLDLTLVNSAIAAEARMGRNWPLVYSLIPKFRLYDGMQEVFDYIRNTNANVAIVSAAPSTYVWKVIEFFLIPAQTVIGYHDAKRKPSPDGMRKAMIAMNAKPNNTISFGDRPIDIIASKAAKIKSVGCLWGAEDSKQLILSSPDILLQSPNEIINLLCSQVN